MSHSSTAISQINAMQITDWLLKLGEKAFLAWIHFQSWDFQRNTPNESLLIPLSLNKVIKRLKTGKATFYNQILPPLVQFGLVGLQRTTHSKQEMNLVVHSSPCFPVEHDTLNSNSDEPSLSESDGEFMYETHPDNLTNLTSASKENEPQTLHSESTILENKQPYKEIDDLIDHTPLPLNLEDPLINAKTYPTTASHQDHEKNTKLPTLDSLPPVIQQTVMGDPRLIERSQEIIQTYLKCYQHPHYADTIFNRKMLTCIEYPKVKKEKFGAYLLRALLNDFDANPAVSPSPPIPKPAAPAARSHDVPEWIVKQQERQKLGIREPSAELDPEQQAEAERLLRALGEWPSP